jgi:hypothetical protein
MTGNRGPLGATHPNYKKVTRCVLADEGCSTDMWRSSSSKKIKPALT